MSLCEQLIGSRSLGAQEKSLIDRCAKNVYRNYRKRGYKGKVPTLKDFRADLLKQSEPEAQEIALAIELFTDGSLNTFAKETNVDVNNRLICYDILDLGKQLLPIGMLVVLDSILNRISIRQTSCLPFGNAFANTVRSVPVLRRTWMTFCRATRQELCLQTRSSLSCSIRRLLTELSLQNS